MVLPLDTHLPTLRGALVLHLAVLVHKPLVSVGIGGQAAPVPNHCVEQHHYVAVLITHVVHRLSYHVSCGGGQSTIVPLDLVLMSVKCWDDMSSASHFAVLVTLVLRYLSPCKGATARQ